MIAFFTLVAGLILWLATSLHTLGVVLTCIGAGLFVLPIVFTAAVFILVALGIASGSRR